jgi:hypothetical protein
MLTFSHESFSQHKAKHYEADIGGGVFPAKPSSLKGNHMALDCSFLRPCHSFGNAKANLLASFFPTTGQLLPEVKATQQARAESRQLQPSNQLECIAV